MQIQSMTEWRKKQYMYLECWCKLSFRIFIGESKTLNLLIWSNMLFIREGWHEWALHAFDRDKYWVCCLRSTKAQSNDLRFCYSISGKHIISKFDTCLILIFYIKSRSGTTFCCAWSGYEQFANWHIYIIGRKLIKYEILMSLFLFASSIGSYNSMKKLLSALYLLN